MSEEKLTERTYYELSKVSLLDCIKIIKLQMGFINLAMTACCYFRVQSYHLKKIIILINTVLGYFIIVSPYLKIVC